MDDCSSDGTYELALELGIKAVKHPRNRGYGGNQKTCYALALERGADIVVMLHPDYQYDPRVIPFMTGIIEDGICDVVLGNRIRTRAEALSGGMPVYKYLANRFLTGIENLAAGQNLGEWHSGLRAYSRPRSKISTGRITPRVSPSTAIPLPGGLQGSASEISRSPARYFPEAFLHRLRRVVRYGLLTCWPRPNFS